MDDFRLLQTLRADAPEPGLERLSRLRTRLDAAPVRRAGHRRFPLLLAGAVTMAAAVAFALVVDAHRVTPRGPGEAARTQRPSLAAPGPALERAALVAERRPLVSEPGPRQWEYTKTLDRQNNGRETIQARWFRYDGRKSASVGEDGRIHVWNEVPDPEDDDLYPKQYADKLRALPTDPDKLLAHVIGDRHWSKPLKENGEIVEEPGKVEPTLRAYGILTLYLTKRALMPPRLEAAIFRALAKIPCVRVEPGVADARGRLGLGIFCDSGTPVVPAYEGDKSYTIVDPVDYRYLGSRAIAHIDFRASRAVPDNRPVAQPMRIEWTTALLSAGIVDRPGQVP